MRLIILMGALLVSLGSAASNSVRGGAKIIVIPTPLTCTTAITTARNYWSSLPKLKIKTWFFVWGENPLKAYVRKRKSVYPELPVIGATLERLVNNLQYIDNPKEWSVRVDFFGGDLSKTVIKIECPKELRDHPLLMSFVVYRLDQIENYLAEGEQSDFDYAQASCEAAQWHYLNSLRYDPPSLRASVRKTSLSAEAQDRLIKPYMWSFSPLLNYIQSRQEDAMNHEQALLEPIDQGQPPPANVIPFRR